MTHLGMVSDMDETIEKQPMLPYLSAAGSGSTGASVNNELDCQ